jgi:hypothetical protein
MGSREQEFIRKVLITHPKRDELQGLANSVFNPENDPNIAVPHPRMIAHRFFEIFNIDPPALNASKHTASTQYVRALSEVTGFDEVIVEGLLTDQPSD